MRLTISAICVLLIAGCGGGNDPGSAAAAVAEATAPAVSRGDAQAEVKTTTDAWKGSFGDLLDGLVFLYAKIQAPSSKSALSASDVRAVRASFDEIGDSILKDK